MGVARGLVAGGVFVAAAVGLALHAAAEPPIGRYTATVIDDSSGQEVPGKSTTLTFKSCGPGCDHVLAPGGAFELHPQDGNWTGTAQTPGGHSCTNTVDANLVWTHSCTGPSVRAQLKKSG